MIALQQWWQSLVKREQIVVAILTIIVVLLTFQSLVWQPLYQGRDNARNSVDKQAQLLSWMNQQAVVAKQLKASSSQVNRSSQSISQRINAAAKRTKIEINRFQTSGENKVQVWLDNADFSKSLLWLEALQKKQGVVVDSITVSETNKVGSVAIRATLSTN
ncbi:MAG: hypothetical protein GQ547_02180 [Methylophaga sp.]|nr:hypothetical protein [Methylophaga sp.]